MRRPASVTVLALIALAVGAMQAGAATMKSATFSRGVLKTGWALDSGDCASVVSISRSLSVDSYGYFTERHFTWATGNCLAVENTRKLDRSGGLYSFRGHRLSPGTYHVQVQYCHDSDFSKRRGNYYCRGTNVKSVRIPRAGPRPHPARRAR